MEGSAVAAPQRYTPRQAAAFLGIDVQHLYALVRGGVLTAEYPNGRGPGKRMYVVGKDVRARAKAQMKAGKKRGPKTPPLA